jgi:hypothetical protein
MTTPIKKVKNNNTKEILKLFTIFSDSIPIPFNILFEAYSSLFNNISNPAEYLSPLANEIINGFNYPIPEIE